MKHTKVSVIIPVYNRVNLVDDALKILKSQTLKDIEFLIVDDGSEDGSYDYLVKTTKSDERFKIFRLDENSGPSNARNFAINQATGEYIGFFDIDDKIPKNYFEKLFKSATENKVDIVFTTYNNLKHSKIGKLTDLTEKIESLYDGALWDKLFKTSLIIQNSIDFPVGLYCADNVFVFKAFYYTKSVFVCNNPIYTYSLSSDSISCDSAKEVKRKSDILKILEIIVNFVKKNGFTQEQISAGYNFLQRTFDVYHDDEQFCRKRDNILLKIRPKRLYSCKSRKIRVKSGMFWIRMGKNLGIISREDFEKLLDAKQIEKSGLFDTEWYFEQYPEVAEIYINPVMHYLETGWKQGYNPSPRFDTNKYLSMYPDVADAKICPLLHYVKFGCKEGRLPELEAERAKKIKNICLSKEKLSSALKYPVRVYDEYHNLKKEIKKLENNK